MSSHEEKSNHGREAIMTSPTKVQITGRSEQQSAARLEALERNQRLHAEEVELRLQNLNERLDSVNAAAYLVRLKTGVHRFDPVLDLRVKVEAVRWMLRIAKHLNDHARETVFFTVMNSLEQLEKAVDCGVDLHETGVHGAQLVESNEYLRHA
jgi:hypothetical protein